MPSARDSSTERRSTRQRSAILGAFMAAGRPLRPDEAHQAALKQVPKLGLATVYRTIKRSVDDGELVAVDVPGEPSRYELAGKKHHHHFLCRQCGRMYDVDQCSSAIAKLAPPGFTVDEHHITLLGVCRPCKRG